MHFVTLGDKFINISNIETVEKLENDTLKVSYVSGNYDLIEDEIGTLLDALDEAFEAEVAIRRR